MLRRVAAAAAPFALAILFSHGVCGVLFSCGCVPFTMEHCSIHHPELAPCPWCTGRVLFPLAIVLWGGGALAAGWLTRERGLAATLGASLAGVLLAIALSGALTVVVTGYPTLLGFSL
jgi:hypothetical protein